MPIDGDVDHKPTDEDPTHREITTLVIAYLDSKGVSKTSRGSLVAEITGLSPQHARRRLTPEGPPWLVSELGKIARYYGETLSELLPTLGTSEASRELQTCEIQFAERWYAAQALIGGLAKQCKPGEIVAFRHGHRWRLVPREDVPAGSDAHEVANIGLLPKPSQHIHVAILDDDDSVATSLREALAARGFSVTAFASEELLAQQCLQFDVFIIDFVLGAGKTASAIVDKVREGHPLAPIVLLTGHAREAGSSEIATLVRSHGVEVQEKPAQVDILESMIESRLQDRRSSAPL
ncbi:helix-turn-helix domain-containing protein [Aquabacterium sp.]|uniref:helix-turn-helix domain-containing protein n=1 Tax=Aquabacterium sp. TaxID=1872578 RepID=UPI004037B2DD